jgi:hypothetical protein
LKKNTGKSSLLKKISFGVKKVINRKEKGRGFFNLIKNKLILSFMTLVCLIIILGFVSYQLAASNSIKNYERSTSQTLNMVGENINQGMDSIKDLSVQYLADDDLGSKLEYRQGDNQSAGNGSYQCPGWI